MENKGLTRPYSHNILHVFLRGKSETLFFEDAWVSSRINIYENACMGPHSLGTRDFILKELYMSTISTGCI